MTAMRHMSMPGRHARVLADAAWLLDWTDSASAELHEVGQCTEHLSFETLLKARGQLDLLAENRDFRRNGPVVASARLALALEWAIDAIYRFCIVMRKGANFPPRPLLEI